MPEPQPMPDVLVLVPGILGSVLVKDGQEVWGSPGKSVASNLRTFGGALKALECPSGMGHNDPKDGVTAPRVLPRLGLIPRLCKADGYGRLVARLKERFKLTPATDDQVGNIIEFAYDWRLSCRLNAQRLSDCVVPVLDRWRQATANPNAKLVFICHSMGGLVARYFLEKMKGRELTSKLITMGTPYRGAVNALEALINGVFLGLGPVGIGVDKLVRSFPSVHQLLPTYDCLDLGNGELLNLSGRDLPNLDRKSVSEALTFHSDINDAVEPKPKYQIFVIKGIDQPTSQSALLRNGRIEPMRRHKGTDHAGDGTVPRPSAHPPEWTVERESVFVSQSHALLQSTDSVLTQIFGILTGHLGTFMGGTGIGLDIPPVVEASKTIPVTVISQDGDPMLALHVLCHGEDGQPVGTPKLMKPLGAGRYQASFDGLPEGGYRITVQSATPAKPLDPVSDWTLVWNANAG